MRSVNALAAVLVLPLFGAFAAVQGCSTNGGDDDSVNPVDSGGTAEGGSDGTVAAADSNPTVVDANRPDTTVPPQGDANAGDTSPAMDAGTDVGIFDAAPVILPETGSPCSPSGAMETQACGACGTQPRTCTGTPPVWGPWGTCTGELEGGCIPGTTSMQECGFCGMATITCQADCNYATTVCTGQVANGVCTAGSVDFEPDPSCDDAGVKGKERTCTNCVWGPTGACMAPPTTLTVPTTAGAVVDTTIDLKLTSTSGPLLDPFECPTTIDPVPADATAFVFFEVRNTSTKKAVVSIWLSPNPLSNIAGTVMIATYPGATPPSTVTERKMCTQISDSCDDLATPNACVDGYGGLMLSDDSAVTIPANTDVQLYIAAEEAGDNGPVGLSVRTESLQ